MTHFLSRKKNQRGQTSLFMALFIFTMITMFAFTTNIGMLVHAKINLQNAADAAAYAGAATQARQLTAAAYLNWEMRRALKEFMFYYEIRGFYSSMPCFPLDANGTMLAPCYGTSGLTPTGQYNFGFFDPREANFNENGPYPFLPSVCIIFDANNNYCQKGGVPGIPQFQGGGSWGVADPIVAAVTSATNQIIEKKLADCLGRTQVNEQFLATWLFNLNPFPGQESLITIGSDSDDPFPTSIAGLDRVGILPRMALLRARIDNFEEYLNMNLSNEGVGSNTVTDETMGTLRTAANGGGKTLEYFERPIQAFLSAKNNLPGVGSDNGIFANIALNELVPSQPGDLPTGQGMTNSFVKNPPILVKFKDLFTDIKLANSRFTTVAGGGDNNAGNCHQYRELRDIPNFPYGVAKVPTIPTYYAVLLQAQARLLFSPFGGNGVVTLSAYSAAKPFGSRIGKDLALNQETVTTEMTELGLKQMGDLMTEGFTPAFPNVLVSNNDVSTNGGNAGGFTSMANLGYIRNAMMTLNRLDIGPRLSGAYAPWEVGYYTVPANFQSPSNVGLFEDNPDYQGKYFALYAPIFPVNSATTDLDFLNRRIFTYLDGTGNQDPTYLEGKYADFQAAALNPSEWALLYQYLQVYEEFYNQLIPDPLLNDEPTLLQYVKNVGARFTVAGMANPQNHQFTSWNNQKTSADSDLGVASIAPNSELGPNIGRSGYSVRFISFNTLKAGGQGTNDPLQPSATWNNPFTRMQAGGAGNQILQDLSNIKH